MKFIIVIVAIAVAWVLVSAFIAGVIAGLTTKDGGDFLETWLAVFWLGTRKPVGDPDDYEY